MQTETRSVETPDGEMPVYVAHPDEQPSRAVIVIQEAFGVNDHIQDVTRRTAAAGYLGVAPHVFHRSGGGVVNYGDMEGVMKHFQALSDKGLLDDIDATLGLIHGEGITDGSVGVVGFCVGGRLTFVAGAERALGAASSFYRGSGCSATSTRGYRSTTSRSCARPSKMRRLRPRSFATRRPATASTAMRVRRRTTPKRRRTGGDGRSPGSASTWRSYIPSGGESSLIFAMWRRPSSRRSTGM